MKIAPAAILLASALLVAAHPGHRAPIKRSEAELTLCDLASSQSARHVSYTQHKRIEKRVETLSKHSSWFSSVSITTESPFYPRIQNETCVLTPGTTTDPYIWSKSQTLRQDMTEDQLGIPLILDIGVIDVNTCEPMRNVLVDLCHCNANEDHCARILHRARNTHSRPFHQNWGTVKTSSTAETGQIFLAEDLSKYSMSYQPYFGHTEIERTTNDVDSIYLEALVNGWFPELTVIPIDGEEYSNDIIGYITIGVDLSRSTASSFN
ncbi:hypothetical protein DFS33DRAFT_1056587 [Desarmillaria ectypa]|nr:hypothetical protein DFS33DRAFT_1056587 [Desarmillaria ectypa]